MVVAVRRADLGREGLAAIVRAEELNVRHVNAILDLWIGGNARIVKGALPEVATVVSAAPGHARIVRHEHPALAILDNGVDAIVMLQQEVQYTPDFIFLDVNMPKMNGVDCLRELKRIKRLEDTKIFMYSTSSEKSTVDKTLKLGANEFIVKPTKTTELKEKLSQIFGIVSRINA